MQTVLMGLCAIICSVMHFFITKNNYRYVILKQEKEEVSPITNITILLGAIIFSLISMGLWGLFLPLVANSLGKLAGRKEASYFFP